MKEVALTWTAAWPMWTAVKHNNSKHLRRQDSGIFDKVHVYRCAVGGGAVEGFFISHRRDPPQKRVDLVLWFGGCSLGVWDALQSIYAQAAAKSCLWTLKPAKVSSCSKNPSYRKAFTRCFPSLFISKWRPGNILHIILRLHRHLASVAWCSDSFRNKIGYFRLFTGELNLQQIYKRMGVQCVFKLFWDVFGKHWANCCKLLHDSALHVV